MMDVPRRAPIRRWGYVAYIVMRSGVTSSGEGSVQHTVLRCAMKISGFVRVRIRGLATRVDPYRVPVTPTFDNQLWPRARQPSDKHDHMGDVSWGVPRHEDVRRLQPIGVTTALPSTMRLGEPSSPAMDARATTLCFDMTAEMRIGFRSVSLTIEVLPRSARPRRGQDLRGIGDGAVLWQLYRWWFVPDGN